MNSGAVIDEMMPHIGRFGYRVSAAGVRLGSIIYMGFGPIYRDRTPSGVLIDNFPAILEFGADEWSVRHNGVEVLGSGFADVKEARATLNKFLVDRNVIKVDVSDSYSNIYLSGNGIIESIVTDDPASGFLYHFRANDGPCWDTVDGITRVTEF